MIGWEKVFAENITLKRKRIQSSYHGAFIDTKKSGFANFISSRRKKLKSFKTEEKT